MSEKIYVKTAGYPEAIIGGDTCPAGYAERTAEEYRDMLAALPPLPEPPPPPEPVPAEVLRWALRAELDERGQLPLIDSELTKVGGKAGRVARRQWAECLYIERAHPMTTAIGAVLGYTADQLDQLFRDAAKLT